MIWRNKHWVLDQIEENSTFWKTGCFGFRLIQSAEICSVESDSAKSDDLVS
jgi:hypothetical protein